MSDTDCPDLSSNLYVSYIINRDQTFAVRVHVRDHIGTSAMSRVYGVHAPVPDLGNAFTLQGMTLFGHEAPSPSRWRSLLST